MGGRSAMQNAGGMAGDATPFGNATGFPDKACFPDKAWASLAATGGMLLTLFAYWALETYGPSSRVVFLDYLPLLDARNNLVAAALGAWLGARTFRLFRSGMNYSSARLVVGCVLGGVVGLIVAGLLILFFVFVLYAAGIRPDVPLASAAAGVSTVIVSAVGAWLCGIALFRSRDPTKRGYFGWLPSGIAASVAVWLILPQFSAFPSHGSIAEREAWARANIHQYVSLMHIVENIPLIKDSVGGVTAIAPASGVQQVTAGDMDGIMMRLVLDVVGDKGAGTLQVRCTIDGDTVFDWQPATWTINGTTTEIATVSNLLLRR
jgi:hypothetical protein